MKLTMREIINLNNALKAVGHHAGVKFAYAVARNQDRLSAEIKALESASKPSKEYLEYDQARIELCIKHAEKDEHARARLDGGAFLFSAESKVAYEKEYAETLVVKYKSVIDARKIQLVEYEKLLDTETEFAPYNIAFEDCPGAITPAEMTGIFKLVAEPKKE